jgi:glutamine synthetase
VLNKLDPGEPIDKNMYELPPEEIAKGAQNLRHLPEALTIWKRSFVPVEGRCVYGRF